MIRKYLIIFSSIILSKAWENKINIYSLLNSKKKYINPKIKKKILVGNFNANNVDGLIFEGGGTRAICYQGVIKYLEEINKLDKIKYLSGTSAGAITASLIAFGYSSKEIENIILSINWPDLINTNIALTVKDIYHLTTDYGIYNGDYIQKYLDKLYQQKFNIKLCTFKQLYDLKGIYLRVGVCCINDESFQFLDYVNSPNMPISLGVRASSSIPLLITTAKWNNNIYIDGGILGNLPIKAFPDKKCIAFDLISDEEKKNKQDIIDKDLSPKNLLDFIFIVFNILFYASQKENGYTNITYQNISVVEIDTFNIGILDFDLNKKKINKLFNSGYYSIKALFNYTNK